MTRVLLADDEEALRLLMSRQLRRAGYDVTVVEDGQAAAELLEKETFNVIVSDMKMPRLDGMGLLEIASKIAPTTEFIILTGHGNMENAVHAFKTGNVFDYLLKPLNDIRELDAVVERAAERQRLRSENSRMTQELELQAENQRLVIELEKRVGELEEARQKLARLAERDGLTGLLNHRAIHSRLEGLLRERPNATVSVISMDMDCFKNLNDTYGHPVGDMALRHLADTLRAVCGGSGSIGRCGGDEFMIVLPNAVAAEAAQFADAARARLQTYPFRNPEGVAIPLRLCFGIADTVRAGGDFHTLITAADSALYQGKRSGGNAVKLHLVGPDDAHANEPEAPEGTSFDVLDGLVTAIDNKDKYTKAHSIDMTNYALALTDALGHSDATRDIVRVAGLLHDVGKIGVPDNILQKPGKLTDAEYEVMKKHVTLSSLIIHGLPHMADILDAVACHHERWDGGGYPKGLKGEDIPQLGRIMAIADAFSAMTLDRPYRVGLSVEEALIEIERHSGTQFDPTLAALFIKTIRQTAPQNLPLPKAA